MKQIRTQMKQIRTQMKQIRTQIYFSIHCNFEHPSECDKLFKEVNEKILPLKYQIFNEMIKNIDKKTSKPPALSR